MLQYWDLLPYARCGETGCTLQRLLAVSFNRNQAVLFTGLFAPEFPRPEDRVSQKGSPH
jgi:hypothetical protein